MAAGDGQRSLVRRGLLGLGVLAVTWFAVQGGEYSTLDLYRQRRTKGRTQARLAAVQREVDSLDAVRTAILTNAQVQERIAREEFGMVRGDKELLYRFAEKRDSAVRRP